MLQKVDYFIVGQGLAGSCLAWELLQRGKTVRVFDEPENNRASAVAAGLYNPITGRVMTRTWKADTIFPFMEKFYGEAEGKLSEKFLFPVPVYRPFVSAEENRQWKIKGESEEMKKFISMFHDTPSFVKQVINPFGGIEIAHSGYLNVRSWVASIRKLLQKQESYCAGYFRDEDLNINTVVQYGDWEAGKIVFCNGLAATRSRWFNWIPLKPLKGEILDVRIDVGLDRIYNRGAFLVPAAEQGIYKAGATYVHAPFSESTTHEARQDLTTRLEQLIRLPFEVLHQEWGIRPATPDRRPVLGVHPANKNVIIFNGLGTKGVSLAPYFARHLSDWMEGQRELNHEVNIFRFKALYSGLQ